MYKTICNQSSQLLIASSVQVMVPEGLYVQSHPLEVSQLTVSSDCHLTADGEMEAELRWPAPSEQLVAWWTVQWFLACSRYLPHQ